MTDILKINNKGEGYAGNESIGGERVSKTFWKIDKLGFKIYIYL